MKKGILNQLESKRKIIANLGEQLATIALELDEIRCDVDGALGDRTDAYQESEAGQEERDRIETLERAVEEVEVLAENFEEIDNLLSDIINE